MRRERRRDFSTASSAGQIDEEKITTMISPKKDVDGFLADSIGALCLGTEGFRSCTPAGVIELIRRSGYSIEGKECVVVGRSNHVGKPMALLLLQENGTVTIAHSRTKNLGEITKKGRYSCGRRSGRQR